MAPNKVSHTMSVHTAQLVVPILIHRDLCCWPANETEVVDNKVVRDGVTIGTTI